MFKEAIISKVRQSYEMINARADRNPEYRKKVLQNPRRAIFEATGFAIPQDWDITIVDVNGRLRIHIENDRWLRNFGLSKKDIARELKEIIYEHA